jgi:hypothetical protein
MTEETTSEQLAEIEGQATEFTPPNGWRVVQEGEELRQGDVRVNDSGAYSAVLVTVTGVVPPGTRYIRPIEPQPQPIQVREGRWRTRNGDIRNVTPTPEGDGREQRFPWWDAQYRQTWTSDGRYYLNKANQRDLIEYLGPLESEPQSEPQPEPEPVPPAEPIQVREGRWRTRGGEIRNITPTPGFDGRAERWPWWDGIRLVWTSEGRYYLDTESPFDLVEHLGPIEAEDKTQEPQPAYTADELQSQPDTELQAQVTFLKGREVTLGTRLQQEREVTTRLRGELESVQNLLGTERQRVTQLEDLVGSLRAINEAQEKAFEAAGKENTDLQHRLNVVATEWAEQAETIRRLQIELDAAQQVPADSPELQQLRLRLADMTLDRDQCKTAYDQIFADLVTIRETTTAETVEAIVEWLQPFRGCNSPALALLLLEALPHIMRHLTGLAED